MPVTLHHTCVGNGPPLVILHGLFGSGTNWRTVVRHLAQFFTCYAVDLRNHGRSPHVFGMHYTELAADVLAWIDRQRLHQICVIGHSMGGKTAMQLALTNPERISAMIVVDIAPIRSQQDYRPLLHHLINLDLSGNRRADLDARLATTIADDRLRMFLLQSLRSTAAGFAWRIGLEQIQAGLDDILDFPLPTVNACYPGPVLFVRGAASDYVPIEAMAAIRPLFPTARLQTLNDAGHWVHAEQPVAFISAVTAFLCALPSCNPSG